MHILNYNKPYQIVKAIKEQKLEVWVASYGGSCSNILVESLEKNGIKCKCSIWGDALCHAPKYINVPIKTIYIYKDIRLALMSMYRRGGRIAHVNQKKLSNNHKFRAYSEENLLKLMISQFKNWMNEKDNKNILFIKSDEIFKEGIKEKIEQFIGKEKIEHLPIKYKKPFSNINNLSEKYKLLFEKYEDDINMINSFKFEDL